MCVVQMRPQFHAVRLCLLWKFWTLAKTETAYQNPNLFEGAAPVSGGGSGITASNFTHTKIVGAVGTRDADGYEYNMTWAVQQIKHNTSMTPRLIKYQGATHDTITASINYSALFGCLFNDNCDVSFDGAYNGNTVKATVYFGD